MPHDPPPVDRNANSDVWELIQALVLGRVPSDRILELFYWGQKPGVLELVRAILDLRPENSATIAAFLSAADAKSISIEVDGSGRLILSSPSISNAAMIPKAGKLASVGIDKHDHKKRPRNIRSA
jgi:hypothetical protein